VLLGDSVGAFPVTRERELDRLEEFPDRSRHRVDSNARRVSNRHPGRVIEVACYKTVES
jgi:hypothetical protein